MRARLLAALACGGVLLGGCASDNTLKLFPGRDGNPTGGVAVLDPETGADKATIDQASSKARIGANGARVGRFDESALSKKDRALLAFLPPKAKSFILDGFGSEDTTLTPDQIAFIQRDVRAEIAGRPGAEVVVIGHANRTGDETINDQVSLGRATAVSREIAKALGMPEDKITVAGRGYREPLKDTDPADKINRRVEIVVR